MHQQHELGPDDDPYVAYLLWRAERDAAAAEAGDDRDDGSPADAGDRPVAASAAVSARAPVGFSSWLRRLAIWNRKAG
ncbi:hypothetical protein [Agromyces flavus]|uniref:hypothetical protein n=1 Tax=Agromyces flavus TaxID=589382 RepID=UPI0012F7C553|nr:hypothetical protein [Agromyces flavus]